MEKEEKEIHRFFRYRHEARPICRVTWQACESICGLCYSCRKHCHCELVRLVLSGKLEERDGIFIDSSPETVMGMFHEVYVDMERDGKQGIWLVMQISEVEAYPGFPFAIERVNAIIGKEAEDE